MNYRHAFHAGNFADVIKHVILVRILEHLRTKPAPFRVIDTHAGSGLYDLAGAQASRSGEWRNGIARLLAFACPPAASPLLAPYLDAVRAANRGPELRFYPGSPLLARSFLRQQDRLIACEREERAAAALARNLSGDRRCKAIAIDGWTALNAYVPPKERRGLILIDPSYEETADFMRVTSALSQAHRKWPTGIYLIWYPIKDAQSTNHLAQRLRRSTISKILRAEIVLSTRLDPDRLNACGVVIVNPPWSLEGELRSILPQLVQALAQPGGTSRIDWLAREAPPARKQASR